MGEMPCSSGEIARGSLGEQRLLVRHRTDSPWWTCSRRQPADDAQCVAANFPRERSKSFSA